LRRSAEASVERYQRQQAVNWLRRERLREIRIAVVGAGAIGNEVLKNLALLGVGQVDVIDFDIVEIHNLTRSVLFRESDVGKSKAHVAARRAAAINPDVEFRAVHADLWKCLNVSETARYDCVVACVDNFEARMRTSLLCRLAAVDFISAAIDSRYVSVQRHPFASLASSIVATTPVACYECDMSASAYQAVAQRYSCGWLRKVAMATQTIPTTAITASVAGSFTVARALGMETETSEDVASRLLVDTHSGHASPTTLAANDACLACGGLPARAAVRSFSGTLQSLRDQWRAAGRDSDQSELMPAPPEDASTVFFSEPLVTGCRCANDPEHCRELNRSSRLSPARDYSDAITWCAVCADTSIDVEIHESLTVSEWHDQFRGESLGCRFVSVTDAVGAHAVFDNDSVESTVAQSVSAP